VASKISTNKEIKYVVNPLCKWLKNQKADWKMYKPRYGTSSTGWDIEAQRKNQDLLIEAKYIQGPFLSSFSGLIVAPLAKRRQHFMKRKYRSWCYHICWAIGYKKEFKNLYQIMFDYFIRNIPFWQHYCKDLRMKYIFLVRNEKVCIISFSKCIELAKQYRKKLSLQSKLKEKRKVAALIMQKYLKT